MVQQRWSNRFNPTQLLDSAYTTIGTEKAEEMGLVKNGYQRFNYQHIKALEGIVGNVVVLDINAHLNLSESEDGVRNYGGLTGSAGMNLNGQPTLRSTIPAIVIPDRKNNTQQGNYPAR